MRTVAWEAAFRIALRDCSTEAGWRSVANVILVKGQRLAARYEELMPLINDFSAFLDMGRCKSWAHKIFSWQYLSEELPVFPRMWRASFLTSTLDSFQRVLKVRGYSGSWFKPCRGRWQVPTYSWQKFKRQMGATSHTYWAEKCARDEHIPSLCWKGLNLTRRKFSWVSPRSQF